MVVLITDYRVLPSLYFFTVIILINHFINNNNNNNNLSFFFFLWLANFLCQSPLFFGKCFMALAIVEGVACQIWYRRQQQLVLSMKVAALFLVVLPSQGSWIKFLLGVRIYCILGFICFQFLNPNSDVVLFLWPQTSYFLINDLLSLKIK